MGPPWKEGGMYEAAGATAGAQCPGMSEDGGNDSRILTVLSPYIRKRTTARNGMFGASELWRKLGRVRNE